LWTSSWMTKRCGKGHPRDLCVAGLAGLAGAAQRSSAFFAYAGNWGWRRLASSLFDANRLWKFPSAPCKGLLWASIRHSGEQARSYFHVSLSHTTHLHVPSRTLSMRKPFTECRLGTHRANANSPGQLMWLAIS